MKKKYCVIDTDNNLEIVETKDGKEFKVFNDYSKKTHWTKMTFLDDCSTVEIENTCQKRKSKITVPFYVLEDLANLIRVIRYEGDELGPEYQIFTQEI